MYAVLARLGRGFGLGLGRTRQPVILHGEHAQLPEEEKRGKRFRQRRVFYGFTRGIHVVSHGMREDFGRAGFGVGDWHVVVNGVDVEKFRPRETGAPGAVRGELGLSEREVVLGLVGRYGPFKGHLRLLRAFERLAVDRPELRLVFVGDGGPEREAVTEAVGKSAVRDQIIQVGYQAEMKGYYQALDLLVVPSLNEGLSNAVLEAMSCGVPVLAHPACGNGDVLGDGREGYLREMGDAGQVTRALEEVLADRANWAELGAGGRRKAVEEFGIAGMAANYLKLYRQLSPRREPSWGVADGENALRGAET
jgi:glycosyltransferase involved in cell wall biosynthesis